MNGIDQIREVLHGVAGVLVWPVLLSLLALAAAMLVTLGDFAREALLRLRGRRTALEQACAALDAALDRRSPENLDMRLERILQDEELRRWKGLSRLRLAVRVGPALGLMGTLIPMAYALQGLAQGDLPTLASNLVTAFAATVIGLAISIIAYLVAAAREVWIRADTGELTFHAEHLLRQSRTPSPEPFIAHPHAMAPASMAPAAMAGG